MKLKHCLLIPVTLGLASLPPALACEFHGGGFGQSYGTYDTDWLSYYNQDQVKEYETDKQYSTMSDLIDEAPQTSANIADNEERAKPVTKPSFSSSASRASNIAKQRLAKNKSLKTASLDTQSGTP